MRAKWTGKTIWFMPEEEDGNNLGDQLPLRSYLTFPINLAGCRIDDFVGDTPLTHNCPRIFAIGVLLLEIGLSQPLPIIKRHDEIGHANAIHRIAASQLRKLKGLKWDGFHNKAYFDEAVAYCFDSNNFFVRPVPAGNHGESRSDSPGATDKKRELATRREVFRRNVVLPLEWLAKKGFGSGTVPRYIRQTGCAQDGNPLLEALPSGWVKNLRRINTAVERNRRSRNVQTTPITVAVLDTGFSDKLPNFVEDSSKTACIKERRDFTGCGLGTGDDVFGHGTFMAKLVMECAPSANLIIGRVAANTKALENSEKQVAEVSVQEPTPGI